MIFVNVKRRLFQKSTLPTVMLKYQEMITISAKLLFSSYQDKEKVLNLMRIWSSAMRCAYGRYSLSELTGNPIWA